VHYIFFECQKTFFLSKLLMDIKTFPKQKFFCAYFRIFVIVYRVRGAVVGENFTQNEEYSSTVKNRQKCVTVTVASSLKGYIYILFTKYIFNRNIEIRTEETRLLYVWLRMYVLSEKMEVNQRRIIKNKDENLNCF
jgi:hypothetical protein